ncbi:MAG: hypothetical protein GQ532_02795 [Methylomarinum sp.]|nr:hypothetical protein [Methylomarinum sp.]
MKTSFNIAWVDDNFNDPEMNDITSLLRRKIGRKNGFSLVTKDVYDEVTKGDFNALLSKIADTIDLSNSFDLILIDYELENNTTGENIANKFRAKLPSVDILFYSGKKSAEDLRQFIANENVDGVYCVGRTNLAADTYTVIENIINRSHKISTLRGLILNSVCEMDHVIKQIIGKYSAINTNNKELVKNEAIRLIKPYNNSARTRLKRLQVHDLLNQKRMMSNNLFKVLDKIKSDLNLSPQQNSILARYLQEIIYLRNTAAHAKEATCGTTGQSMLKNGQDKYRRSDIDRICKTIVSHENNIQSILEDMN